MTLISKCIQVFTVTILLVGCATPRSSGVLGINYSDQPPRVVMRWMCNGNSFSTQGVGVCEQKSQSAAKVSVKIPPIEGHVIYSTAQLKQTEDFNWYPKAGFFLWKKRPITDTWADLNLGEIAATYGDWPVAIDVAGMDEKVGLIVTRGVIYHRVCDDINVMCSKLVVNFECSGDVLQTGPGAIGKCLRMSGSGQAFRVKLSGPDYAATPGAKIYLSIPRLGVNQSFTPEAAAFAAGEFLIQSPDIPAGPMLVGLRIAFVSGGKVMKAETRILVMGFSPEWTGIDSPHYIDQGDHLDMVKPVMSDAIEVNLYQGETVVSRAYSLSRVVSMPKPTGTQVACAFAWARDSSDQTWVCVDSKLNEVNVP